MLYSSKIQKLNLYIKFLGFLIKKGNKIKAKKILDKAFSIVSQKTGYSLASILFKLFLKLNVFVEAKIIRIKRRSLVIPFSLSLQRRSYLIIKWLMKAASENKKKISITEKISAEILLVINNLGSKAVKFKVLNNRQVLANRSNTHYRW